MGLFLIIESMRPVMDSVIISHSKEEFAERVTLGPQGIKSGGLSKKSPKQKKAGRRFVEMEWMVLADSAVQICGTGRIRYGPIKRGIAGPASQLDRAV